MDDGTVLMFYRGNGDRGIGVASALSWQVHTGCWVVAVGGGYQSVSRLVGWLVGVQLVVKNMSNAYAEKFS